ncbi:DUF3408 domain-containing protein [Alistipes sp.]|uniref:DUF3408 domain-containing protein n=1 Tax=Alistipes sp. TaxID=1872444 RepID=UPI003AB41353
MERIIPTEVSTLTTPNESSERTVLTTPIQSTEQTVQTEITQPTDTTVTAEQPAQNVSDRTGVKQQRATLEEYRQTFLRVPKIENRKPVFISCEVRDRLEEIVRRLGGRRMSVSGLIENLARHHLETYGDDIERWRKL